MTTYSYTEAERKLAAVLEEARARGEVRIKREDGEEFAIRRVEPNCSTLDVPGVSLNLSAEEIVSVIREGRERT